MSTTETAVGRRTLPGLHRVLLAMALAVLAGLLSPLHADAMPVDPYAPYRGEEVCSPSAKPGTVYLGRMLVRQYGGSFGRIGARCTAAVSEHQEGRAFDWGLDARRKADRVQAARFMRRAFAADANGEGHTLARRLGIMYLIWNDRIYSAYDHFESRPYLSSSCRSVATCSPTLRHRDHLHVSQSWAGALGRTSFFRTRLPQP